VSYFFDTNILVYAFADDPKKQTAVTLLDQALEQGCVISAQVLGELTNVARRKLKASWEQVAEISAYVREIFTTILPVTEATHIAALRLSQERQLSYFDAQLIVSALEANCTTFYSEDLQHGATFGRLTVVNPFLETP
jgi:predicted nucleic acid-binding protein